MDDLSEERIESLVAQTTLCGNGLASKTLRALLAENARLRAVAEAARAWEADDSPAFRLEQGIVDALAEYDAWKEGSRG